MVDLRQQIIGSQLYVEGGKYETKDLANGERARFL
jgi:hypothetical protein